MGRDEILRRIWESLGSSPEAAPLPDPPEPRFTDQLGSFGLEVERTGAVFLDWRGPSALQSGLGAVLAASQASLVLWESPLLFPTYSIPVRELPERVSETEVLASRHREGEVTFPLRVTTVPLDPNVLKDALLSVSGAYGVADLGTLVNRAGPGRARILPVLPPEHLFLVNETDVEPNLGALLRRSELLAESSAVTLVSGPSRTADIEQTLIRGVHGPGKVYVALTRKSSEDHLE